MNSYSNYQIPPPEEWTIFEDLCLSIWKRIWHDDHAQKNGRKGQKQNGVDFFGRPNKDKYYVGVQCKCKENMLGSKLTVSEIEQEINKAKQFKPKLKEYIIATTSARDANIQEYCRKKTLENVKNKQFSVAVYSWQDIKDLMTQEEIKKFYRYFINPEESIKTPEDLIIEGEKAGNIIEETIQNRGNIVFDSSKVFSEISELEYNEELTYTKSLLESFEVDKALDNLEAIKSRIWDKSSDYIKFRILTNIGSALLYMNKLQEAANNFIEAYQYNKNNEKALSNLSIAYLILKKYTKSKCFSLQVLNNNPTNHSAYSILIQSQLNLNEVNLDEVEKNIPSEVRNSSEIYTMLSFQAYKRKAYKSAVKYGKIALSLDKKENPEIKFNLAIIILESLFCKQNIIFGKQINLKTKELLTKVVNLLSEAWDKVKDKDLAKYKIYWLVNRAKANRILGNLRDAEKDIDLVLHYDPNNPDYLFEKSIISFESNKLEYFEKNRKQVEKIIDFIPQAVLLLAEAISSHDIDDSINVLLKYLDRKSLGNRITKEVLRLLINLMLKNEDYKQAKIYVDRVLLIGKLDVIDKTLISKFYRLSGNDSESNKYIQDGINLLKSNSLSFREELEISNELFYRGQYLEAAEIYKNIVDVSLNDELTHKLIYCYYQVGDYGNALEICKLLTENYGSLKFVSEIQAEIYEAIDEFDKAIETYNDYLNKFPNDINIKIKKARVDYLIKDIQSVKNFLTSIEINNNLNLMQNVFISSLCIHSGMYEKALNLLYETRRRFYSVPNAHLEYIGLFLIKGKYLNSIINKIENKYANENSAVLVETIEDHNKKKWYVIENRKEVDKTLGEISLEDAFTKKMIGKKVGDTFILEKNQVLYTKYKIIEIKNKYLYAYHESVTEFESMFPEAEGFFRIKMGSPSSKKAIEYGLKKIFEINEIYKNKVENVEKLYKRNQINIGGFARIIGRNIYDIWEGLINNKELGIKCCYGTLDERNNAGNLLNKDFYIVIDITSLFTVALLGLKEIISDKYKGRLIISQSTYDLIEQIIAEKENLLPKGYFILNKINDKYVRYEITGDAIKKQVSFLTEILVWISKEIQVMPCTEALDINFNKKQKLDNLIGKPLIDSILIAKNDKNILFSDDLVLRLLAKNDFNVNGIWIQIILIDLLNSAKIKKEIYNDKIINLIKHNYIYVFFDAEILVESLKKANFEYDSEPYVNVLRMLNSSKEESIVNITIDYLDFINSEKSISDVKKNSLTLHFLNHISNGGINKKIINRIKFTIKKKYKILPLDSGQLLYIIEAWDKSRMII